MDPKKERTLVIIKPDGIQRSLIGEIMGRYERTGLKLTAIKFTVPSSEMVEKHYLLDPDWKRKNGEKTIKGYRDKGLTPPFEDPIACAEMTLAKLKKYLSCGPVMPMIWEGMNACGVVRKITGGTEPLTSDVGTVRGDMMIDSYQISDADNRVCRNLVHASGSSAEAEQEIALWFKPEEIIDYRLINEAILYDVNLDGILE